jgi:leucyl/phenylalanyl-tRNA--protein transferase
LYDDDPRFPPAHLADDSGIIAIGGDYSPRRLLEAYRGGIFPWSTPEDPILWWSPDPRCIIRPDEVKVSKSMRQLLRQGRYRVTFDQAFPEVIRACRDTYRPGQPGTWITDELVAGFEELHRIGFAHSVEVWDGDALVGGLYGGSWGRCFFGESMFSKASNASKFGFIVLARNLAEAGCKVIDCQVENPHLLTLGATHMPRKEFLSLVAYESQAFLDRRNWQSLFRTDFDF